MAVTLFVEGYKRPQCESYKDLVHLYNITNPQCVFSSGMKTGSIGDDEVIKSSEENSQSMQIASQEE